MKKFAALIVGLSLLAPIASAQSTATGTFSGSVGGLCVVKSPTSGTLNSARAIDGFPTALEGTGEFSFKSNTRCGSDSRVTAVSGPQSDQAATALNGSCNANITGSKLETPTVIASNSNPVATPVYAEITRRNSFPLLAGQYSLTCETTLTFAN